MLLLLFFLPTCGTLSVCGKSFKFFVPSPSFRRGWRRWRDLFLRPRKCPIPSSLEEEEEDDGGNTPINSLRAFLALKGRRRRKRRCGTEGLAANSSEWQVWRPEKEGEEKRIEKRTFLCSRPFGCGRLEKKIALSDNPLLSTDVAISCVKRDDA